VAFWYSTASTLTAISALYEKFSSFAEKASGKTFETLNNQYFAQLEKVRESADQLTNAVFLYFDLESDTSGAKGPLQVLFDVVVAIQDLAISAQALQDVKLTQTDDLAQQFVQDEEARLRKKVLEELKKFSSTFDASSQGLTLIIKSLRAQMKQFDK
jgi:hypothetical protein